MASQFWKYSHGKSPINLLSERSMMRNLGNLKLDCQLPIAPWNLLDLKIRTCSCGRAPSQKGKISSIWLFLRTRCSSIMQLANDLGIWPWNWFSPKSITLKLFVTVHVWGMGPSRLLLPRSSTDRDLLKLARHWGILPLKLLLDKSSNIRELMLQISGEISPVSLFLETEYSMVDGGGIGSGPCNML